MTPARFVNTQSQKTTLGGINGMWLTPPFCFGAHVVLVVDLDRQQKHQFSHLTFEVSTSLVTSLNMSQMFLDVPSAIIPYTNNLILLLSGFKWVHLVTYSLA